MFSARTFLLLTTALSAILSPATAAPAPVQQATTTATSSYWLANIDHTQDTVWGNNDTSYQVFRDITQAPYNADSTGATDVTDIINKAISDGGRCGEGCNSSTTSPAIIYFPRGTYLVSSPIQMYYYTQMIGDPTGALPVIKGSSSFAGMSILDADPYEDSGANWYINQNNFFRQVRNLEIDMTDSTDVATGIHWQVAQATSLQNMVFRMTTGSNQQGIFMDNGSGGWMSDLTFIGGKYGAFLGSQQFTARNMYFQDCSTAIFMNWNWGWTFSNITIDGSTIGIDMSNAAKTTSGGFNQTVGSVVLTDSKISNTQYGVSTAYSTTNDIPATGGSLVLDNVDMSGVSDAAVWQNSTSTIVLAPGKITSWAQGSGFSKTAKNPAAGTITAPYKAPSLLDPSGNIFGRSKPQYESVSVSSFVSAKDSGCKGDGTTDDTAAIQSFLSGISEDQIAYFPHGAYIIQDTINVPASIKIVGEIWSLMVATGSNFQDASNPIPVFSVGKATDTDGAVEISDIVFETKGPTPGAIMIQWNLNTTTQGASGMWDSHVRIGGSYGTELQEDQCPGWPTTEPSQSCEGVFMMFYATKSSGGIVLENTWFWVADHDLEVNNQTQISIYSGRGVLFQSSGPVWLWGTASEHSAFYNYQIDGVSALFGGFMQSETPYWQPHPQVPAPFTFNSAYDDPTFTVCPNGSYVTGTTPCKDAWGMRVVNSKGVLVYSTGMYSFFNNYAQACVTAMDCQLNMIRIQNSQVGMYTVTTKASVNMIVDSAIGDSNPVAAKNYRNVFGDTLVYYFTGQ